MDVVSMVLTVCALASDASQDSPISIYLVNLCCPSGSWSISSLILWSLTPMCILDINSTSQYLCLLPAQSLLSSHVLLKLSLANVNLLFNSVQNSVNVFVVCHNYSVLGHTCYSDSYWLV